MAHLHQHKTQDPREGPSLAGRTTWSFLRRGLVRLATEGARRVPARAMSSLPLWCKGGKRRREDQAKASISVQRDQDQSNGGEEVIVEPRTASPQNLWQARTNFS